MPVDTHLANLSSHSAFLVLGADGEESTQGFMDEERRHLAAVFPDGMVEERYVVELGVLVR